ncbi:MAG TPA: radical SAM protein [Gemmatimonadales bacterium]|nr:radical SAM protein [Gemmatimonadales bacterium]
MLTFPQVTSNLLVRLNQATDRTFVLPILMFYPTARCNSRCVSCDCWKADGVGDLTLEEIRRLTDELPALHTRLVTFSGGEPTLRRDVYEIAKMFRARGVKLHLLTSGLFLERDAAAVVEHFADVTISLDGHTASLYEEIRGVNGLGVVERGVRRLKSLAPRLPVRARSTLHRHNFRDLPALIDKAHAMGLDGISFLSADVTSESFGRAAVGGAASLPQLGTLLLSTAEIGEFAQVVERAIVTHASDFTSRFVAESPDKLRRLPKYYAAQQGLGPFPPTLCNAPWASAVVEADGTVRPCFFHRAVGNIRERSLREILATDMVEFRRGLNMAADPTCQRCVCTLQVGLRTPLG